jgi:dienelactone hydrolase
MKATLGIALALGFLANVSAATLPDGVSTRDVWFYSEGVKCYGKLFLPKDFASDGKSRAVILAPGWGETAASTEKYAANFAGKGLAAMAIDYRGWGKSGGYVYLAENVRYDDRLRFSQHTAKVRIRRKRLIPDDQVDDIRNAISFLQGEPGIDRLHIGVWGTDMGGGHVMVIAGLDPRVKAVVAQVPVIEGKNAERKLSLPKPGSHQANIQQVEVKLARSGDAPATPVAAAAMNAEETRIALAEYHPFWFVSQIPQTVAVLFVVAASDTKVKNDDNAIAASKALKGPNSVTTVPGTHTLAGKAADQAADAAGEWFVKYL